jgi:hypothetical protein
MACLAAGRKAGYGHQGAELLPRSGQNTSDLRPSPRGFEMTLDQVLGPDWQVDGAAGLTFWEQHPEFKESEWHPRFDKTQLSGEPCWFVALADGKPQVVTAERVNGRRGSLHVTVHDLVER